VQIVQIAFFVVFCREFILEKFLIKRAFFTQYFCGGENIGKKADFSTDK